MAITISGENNNDRILAADGVIDQISGINFSGIITASHINVGSNIQLGNAGIVTATTFVGNVTGNVNSTSPLLLQTGGSERFRITGNNELGIAGANYGSSGQVLTSGGSGSAVSWTTISTDLVNDSSPQLGADLDTNGFGILVDDNKVVNFGNNNDLMIYHSGTHSYIKNKTNNLYIMSTNTEYGIEVHGNGKVRLNYDNSPKIETTNTGAVVTGIITATSRVSLGNNTINAVDLEFGTNRGSAGDTLANINWKWNNTYVAQIRGIAGSDTTNKDDAHLAFFTSAANNLIERLRIDKDGRILIGTTTEGHASADDLTINNSGHGGITIRTGTSSNGAIFFSDATSGAAEYDGYLQYNHGSSPFMQFGVAQSARLYMLHDGTISYRTGGGKGFEFNSSGSSASVAANVFAPASYTLAFGTNGNERLRITSGGSVLIDTTVTNEASGDGSDLIIGSTSDTHKGISIVGSTSGGIGNIFFTDGAGYKNQGLIQYRHADDSMRFTIAQNERLRIFSNGDISIGDGHTSATQKVDILNGSDENNIVIIRGADATTEYAAIGVYGGNAVITGGSSGSNSVGIHFRTADSGTEATRLQLSNGGVLHVGGEAVSNTIPSGGLDLQGNQTNCVLEMGNPFPNYSAGRVPEFRITTVDSSHTVEFRSVWGGTNGLYKHMSMSGGATMFYDGVSTEDEVMRITGASTMFGTTSSSANTQAKGIALNDDGSIVSRRDGVMHYYKSIATGGYYANVFMSANTTVGSIFFNSGGTQFNTSSDYRRKENVVSLTDAISKIKQLKPYRFNFKDNPSETVDGFLAHEAQEIVPHTVTGTKDQVSTSNDVAVGIATTTGEPIYQQMDLSKLVPLLTASLQEAISKIETLEAKVAALESS